MCKGREEEGKQSGFFNLLSPPNDANKDTFSCELCGSNADLYCEADEAFLCKKCDKWVHGANFLASRHIRCLLCHTCQNLTQRYLIGTSVEVVLPTMVVSSKEKSHCDSDDSSKCSKLLKRPFLFF